MQNEVIVFDVGGTLMEYTEMPLSWIDYYKQGFRQLAEDIDYPATEKEIEKSFEIMKTLNPRINYREIEYTPEYIFEKVLEDWNTQAPINEIIEKFFKAMNLSVKIYPDSINTLKQLKSEGYMLAMLTDLPQGMPDELFKKSIKDLLTYIDYYVSSQSCGYRKPNTYGLKMIAEKFCVPIESLVFIGDEEKDEQTSINAGCEFYKIDRTKMELRECLPKIKDED